MKSNLCTVKFDLEILKTGRMEVDLQMPALYTEWNMKRDSSSDNSENYK